MKWIIDHFYNNEWAKASQKREGVAIYHWKNGHWSILVMGMRAFSNGSFVHENGRFRYTKNSTRPGSDFIYTKNSARPRSDFIYTKNFLSSCHLRQVMKTLGGDATKICNFHRGKVGLLCRKSFSCGHHIIMSSCHHVVMS